MALYNRYEKLRKVYVCNDGSKIYTDEYQKGYLIQEYEEFDSVDDCQGTSSGETPTTIYQWVDVTYDSSNTDTYLCQGYDLYSVQKQQYSNDSGKTWFDVEPLNKRTKDLIESNSEVCGYEPIPPIPPTGYCFSGVYNDDGLAEKIFEVRYNNIWYTTTNENFDFCFDEPCYDFYVDDYDSMKVLQITSLPSISQDMTSMRKMFYNFTKLNSINLSNFNTSNVTKMIEMFMNCRSLTSLDLSSFNTSNVTDMTNMFQDCRSLTSLDLSSFDTSNVDRMSGMFRDCSGFTSIDLTSLNTSNVTDMTYMFYGCRSLTTLDLSNFDTSNLGNVKDMFNGCVNLTSLDLSSWDMSKVTTMIYMFSYCTKLSNITCTQATKDKLMTLSDYHFPTKDTVVWNIV